MAPVHVQTQSTPSASAVSSVTYSNFAVGAGANRTLVAYVLWRDDTAAAGPTGSSVVFNTTENFTYRIRAQLNYAGNNYLTAEIWTLDNPSNATANIVATISEANDDNDGIVLIVSEYTGANNGVGANTGAATGNSTNPAVTFTTLNSTSLICAGATQAIGAGGTFTPGTSTVERADSSIGSGGINYFAAEELATGASNTIDETHSADSTRWAIAAIELLAAAGGTQYNQSVSGTSTPAGTVIKLAGKPVSGTVTSAGALLAQGRKILLGTLTSAGTVLKLTAKSMAGTLTSAGTLINQTAKILAGILASFGVVAAVKIALISLGGTLTSAGALVAQGQKALSGAIAPAGTLANQAAKILTGALSPAGALFNQAAKLLSGSLTPSGILAAVKTALISLSGALTPSGSLQAQGQKALSGGITPSGVLARNIGKIVSGVLTPIGSISRSIAKFLTGILDWLGTVAGVLSGGVKQVYTASVYCNLSPTISLDSQSTPGAGLYANPTPVQEIEIG